ncbi:hypothetical protein [Pedobacter gandavensis]|uniref:Uncharacterized protein n=1 Tax=Pedobacter gandavensis TaxID=2679963 RepID=A0ABR6EU49_9SPHI|nr:hypothetical protein [Pedobacter gandavensis]MBB2148793.1 hypothetical protein [Pedobacter gandavensis]
MKGRSVFTHEEALIIKSKLDACREDGRYSTRDFRGFLRKQYDFYISDFDRSRSGFSSSTFDHHVSIGNIKIVEDDHATLLADFENFDYNSNHAKRRFEDLTHRVKNHIYINEEHKKLSIALLKEVKTRIPGMNLN